MAEKNIKWTKQQQRAICQRGSDVLVTASAGTGKTAVLSGRCVDIVSDKSDVRNILVLTFTDAAAEQLRLRIAEQLSIASLQKPDPHLRHQLMLLDGADISTIHSFCKRLITEYFYKLGLDPTFRIIDADEAALLKAEVFEKTIDWAWQQSYLTEGLEQLLRRRDLRANVGFLNRIMALSNFLDGVVHRRDWYERASTLTETLDPVKSDLGEKQKQIIADRLQHILARLRHAQSLYDERSPNGDSSRRRLAEPEPDWSRGLQETHIAPVAQCKEFLHTGRWDICAEKITSFVKPTTRTPKDLDKPLAELIAGLARKAIAEFASLSEFAIVNPDYLDRVGKAAGLQTKVVIEILKKFDRLYSRAKRSINSLDFADLEHYALQLLTDEDSTQDKLIPSETALTLRQRYKYIFVDEYQDINPVQQAILDTLSSAGNVFVVGDVKQSIYAFRGAKPDIFLKLLKQASLDPANAPNGLRVDLNANFRSAKGILDFVNKLFARIMTASFTRIDYDESARLRPASERQPTKPSTADNQPVVEFHILDEKSKSPIDQDNEASGSTGDESLNIITSRQRQAAMIAQRIRHMVGADTGKSEFRIFDKEQAIFRDIEYRDIVILMRSPAKRVNDYVEILRLAKVPVSSEFGSGYFETTEITDILCLLKILDNTQRDIELAAVLRSPFFNISDTELAKIRVHSKPVVSLSNPTDQKSVSFYDCVLRYCEDGPDAELAEKLKRILAQIENWRTAGRRGSLADLIWQIFRQTSLLSFVSALPNGQSRRANLLKLHDRAIQFENFAGSSGSASLRRFVEFIEKLQETATDWAKASPEAAAENAVRIISVHKSKGLEFPVVFLAELNTPFNKEDARQDCIADTSATLGLQIIDRKSNSRLSSLTHQVIAEEKLKSALAEEMRIFYVATTRAAERLILTACERAKHCRDVIRNGFYFGAESIPDWQLRSCRSAAEWLLYALSDQKTLHKAFETHLAAETADDDLFSFKLYSQPELESLSEYILKCRKASPIGLKAEKSKPRLVGAATAGTSRTKQTESPLLHRIKKSLSWQYQFSDIVPLPAKRSVTQLTHHADEHVDPSLVVRRSLLELPLTGHEPRVTSRNIGTATHLLISKLDLAKPITAEAVEQLKAELIAGQAINEAVAEHIDTKSVMKFFESELGRTVLDANSTVWREWPFTFALPTSFFAQATSYEQRDTIIIQGIIDMLVKIPDGLLVIDFKTDAVTAEEAPQRAKFYRQQLDIYSRAASAILRSKSIANWLYFLTPACAIENK